MPLTALVPQRPSANTITRFELLANQHNLAALLKAELNYSDPGWQGYGIAIHPSQRRPTPQQDNLIQSLGAQFGCHQCLAKVDLDTQQPWIGAHIPPTELLPSVRKSLGLSIDNARQVLYAQCYACTAAQSVLVKALNCGARHWSSLTADELKLIRGGSGMAVRSTNPQSSQAQAAQIQELGRQFGCHACGSAYPTDRYVADHVPPLVFRTQSLSDLCGLLGVNIPPHELRPHCRRCSVGRRSSLSHALSLLRECLAGSGMSKFYAGIPTA